MFYLNEKLYFGEIKFSDAVLFWQLMFIIERNIDKVHQMSSANYLENDNLTCSYIINADRLQNVDAIHFIAVLDEFGVERW